MAEKPDLVSKWFLVMGINSNLIKSETDIEMLLDNEDDVKCFMASQPPFQKKKHFYLRASILVAARHSR